MCPCVVVVAVLVSSAHWMSFLSFTFLSPLCSHVAHGCAFIPSRPHITMSSFCLFLSILLSDSISISFSFSLFVCLFVYALFACLSVWFVMMEGQTESPPHPSEPSYIDPKWLDLAFFIF